MEKDLFNKTLNPMQYEIGKEIERKEKEYDLESDILDLLNQYEFTQEYRDKLKQRIAEHFDFKHCKICDNYQNDEDMTYNVWDIGNVEEQICESCRNNQSI